MKIALQIIAALITSLSLGAGVQLTWDVNTELDLAGYRVYWGGTSGQYDQMVDVGNVNTWTLHDIDETRPYYFVVTAYNLDGLESEYSNEVLFEPSKLPLLISTLQIMPDGRMSFIIVQTGPVSFWPNGFFLEISEDLIEWRRSTDVISFPLFVVDDIAGVPRRFYRIRASNP